MGHLVSILAGSSAYSSTRSRRYVALSGAGLIEIDGHGVGDRVALTGEPEAARDLVILEREIHVHVDVPCDEAAAAGRADATLARVRQLDAVADACVDDVLPALFEQKLLLAPVDDHRHFAFAARSLRQRSRDVGVLRNARGEALDADPRCGEA